MQNAKAIFILCALLLSSRALYAQIEIFEDDLAGWLDRVGEDTTLLNFDTIPGSLVTPINGDEFSTLPGAPVFSLTVGTGMYVGNPATDQIPIPPSGENMLGPANSGSIEGIIKVSFDQPINSIGATFVDVEADFNSTGFSIEINEPLPGISFSSSKGQGAFSFLGFVSDSSFTEIEIHFATGSNIDGVLVDDLVYAIVTATSIEDEQVELERAFSLSKFYPNPFRVNTNIELYVDDVNFFRVVVLDILGREVEQIHEGILSQGKHSFKFNGASLPGGVYFVQFTNKNYVITRKAILIR